MLLSHGMWCCTGRWIIADVLDKYTVSVFRVNASTRLYTTRQQSSWDLRFWQCETTVWSYGFWCCSLVSWKKARSGWDRRLFIHWPIQIANDSRRRKKRKVKCHRWLLVFWRNILPLPLGQKMNSALKMEAVGSSGTLAAIYGTTCHNPRISQSQLTHSFGAYSMVFLRYDCFVFKVLVVR
jgi:hypothetical protein